MSSEALKIKLKEAIIAIKTEMKNVADGITSVAERAGDEASLNVLKLGGTGSEAELAKNTANLETIVENNGHIMAVAIETESRIKANKIFEYLRDQIFTRLDLMDGKITSLETRVRNLELTKTTAGSGDLGG